MNKNTIAIIDFGSQVTKLIARRVRENGVYCEIEPFQKINENFLKSRNFKGFEQGSKDTDT